MSEGAVTRWGREAGQPEARRPSRRRVATVVSGVVAMILAIPVGARATHVDPVQVSGNATCSDLVTGTNELKIEPPASGTYPDDDGPLEVTITVDATTSSFSWSSNIGVDAVFVKGGPGGNLYVYDPPAEATGDTGLHAPINSQNGKPYGLSHISFCYDEGGGNTTSSTTSSSTTSTTTPTTSTTTSTSTSSTTRSSTTTTTTVGNPPAQPPEEENPPQAPPARPVEEQPPFTG